MALDEISASAKEAVRDFLQNRPASSSNVIGEMETIGELVVDVCDDHVYLSAESLEDLESSGRQKFSNVAHMPSHLFGVRDVRYSDFAKLRHCKITFKHRAMDSSLDDRNSISKQISALISELEDQKKANRRLLDSYELLKSSAINRMFEQEDRDGAADAIIRSQENQIAELKLEAERCRMEVQSGRIRIQTLEDMIVEAQAEIKKKGEVKDDKKPPALLEHILPGSGHSLSFQQLPRLPSLSRLEQDGWALAKTSHSFSAPVLSAEDQWKLEKARLLDELADAKLALAKMKEECNLSAQMTPNGSSEKQEEQGGSPPRMEHHLSPLASR
mmetsp:Transcript_27/g.66  ORF Transcript_27/g.66 Transcript_27/m.66 type:complete len:330 (-) Transcript_27:829-1818(-)